MAYYDNRSDSISFAKYDSSANATIVESIQHANNNPLLIENLSDRMLLAFENEEWIVQEPNCTFKDMLHFFDDVLQTIPIPKTEYYRPEITAKRIYDNADFWYILLLVNNIFTIENYNQSSIKYIPARELTRITKFIKINDIRTRQVIDADLSNLIL